MRLTLAHVAPRPRDEFDAAVRLYLDRCAPFVVAETQAFKTEEALIASLDRQKSRTPVLPVLLDSRGRQMTSGVFAEWLGARRNDGAQNIVFAIGPSDGWSALARERAQLLLSLGPFTMAHALARLVMAEQLYRAVTILSGHPYHSGH